MRRNSFNMKIRGIHLSYIVGFIVCFSLSSCGSGEYFVFENVRKVEKFPVSIDLQNPEEVDIDELGIQGIEVCDDYILVASHDSAGCLSVFLKDGTRVGNPFLNVGRGPGETLYRPFISWFDFTEDSAGVKAGHFDYKGNYIKYDITRTIATGRLTWECMMDSLSIASGARYFEIDDGRLVCRRKNSSNTGYERFIINDKGEKFTNRAMEYLNSFSSSESNLLATLFLVSPDRRTVAELGSRLNVIQLYSVANDFSCTIAVGDRLQNLKRLETISPEDMPKTYYDAKSYKDFFAALNLNTTIKDLNLGHPVSSELQIFSWAGDPVASIPLPVSALYFDIDVDENQLYVVDAATEKILRYDIDGIREW